jgi:hypothetical protein
MEARHGVGPNQVIDIKRNDVEKRGHLGSITAFLGAKRAIFESVHGEFRGQVKGAWLRLTLGKN